MANNMVAQENPDDLLPEEQIVAAAAPLWLPSIGVYFLIRDGRVAYVGQATNVVLRVAVHSRSRRFDSWAWIPCAIEDLNRLERAYLDAFLPDDNRDSATMRLRGGWSNWRPPTAMRETTEDVPDAPREVVREVVCEEPPAPYDYRAARIEWMRRLRAVKGNKELRMSDFGRSPFARD